MNNKKYIIKIVNNRNVKTLCGGLPSFGEWETFETKADAAKELANRAYELLEAEVLDEDLPDFGDDNDALNEEIGRRIDAKVNEIEMNGHWFYDGVQYYIDECEEDD